MYASFEERRKIYLMRVIERFNLAVLPPAALGDKQRFDSCIFHPTANFSGNELAARVIASIVTANGFGANGPPRSFA